MQVSAGYRPDSETTAMQPRGPGGPYPNPVGCAVEALARARRSQGEAFARARLLKVEGRSSEGLAGVSCDRSQPCSRCGRTNGWPEWVWRVAPGTPDGWPVATVGVIDPHSALGWIGGQPRAGRIGDRHSDVQRGQATRVDDPNTAVEPIESKRHSVAVCR
jgi:hypothetical protein